MEIVFIIKNVRTQSVFEHFLEHLTEKMTLFKLTKQKLLQNLGLD